MTGATTRRQLMAEIERPCVDCGYLTVDVNDPTFTGDWLCYWCHCQRNGFDVKERLNHFSEMVKLGFVVRARAPWWRRLLTKVRRLW